MGGEHVCYYVWVGGDSGRTNTACYVACHAASVIREGGKAFFEGGRCHLLSFGYSRNVYFLLTMLFFLGRRLY